MTLFQKICRAITKFLFRTLYRHETYGTEHIPQGKALIAPNHVSFLDPPLIAISCPDMLHFLAKDVLFKNPIFRAVIIRMNALPVSGKVNDLTTIKSICRVLEIGDKVVIFPEGIRSFDGKLREVKLGTAQISLLSDTPIVPAFIQGTFEIWPRQNKLPKPWGKTLCAFGPPIYPAEYSHLDKKEAQKAITAQFKYSIESLRDTYGEKALD